MTTTGAVAVIVARGGDLPPGSDEAVSEAGGCALVVGDGAAAAAGSLRCADRLWWADTGPGLRAGWLSARLAPWLAATSLVVLADGPDGRDLAPRLAARLDRPLLAHVAAVTVDVGSVRAELVRVDDRIVVPVEVAGPAVATLALGLGELRPVAAAPRVEAVTLPDDHDDAGNGPDVRILDVAVVGVVEPDPSTMDLAEAAVVFGGGAGLAVGAEPARATAIFELLVRVAAAMGASAGATRVATDAGWIGYDRQIGTTGVTLHPKLYVALGVSGAAQHVGGIGAPAHVVSVNVDPSSPMTAMADLGVIGDARAILVELAGRLGVSIPEGVQ